MLLRIITLLFISLLLFSSCKSKKRIAENRKKHHTERRVVSENTAKNNPVVVEEKKETPPTIITKPAANASYAELVSNYINNYSTIAKEEMLQYGIPASITLAQGILESGAGRGELTLKANNHFGIKCHKEWNGDSVYHDDDELQECFRKYKDPKYSYRDHSLFLTQRSRYQDLFKLKKDDYKGWAHGLRKAGYATDPKYPDKLIGIIERYDLTKYDNETLGKKARQINPDESKIGTYMVIKGDTLYSIARRYNVAIETLKEYNGLKSNDIAVGQVLYLHSVKN